MFATTSPMLEEALATLPRTSGTIVAKADGRPYTHDRLTDMMGEWIAAAGIEPGHTLHGLRFALGADLSDADATAHQSRDVLGHRTMSEVQRYARAREQARSSAAGMAKVIRLQGRG